MLADRWEDLRNYEWRTDKILDMVKSRFDLIQREMELEKLGSTEFKHHRDDVLEFVEKRFKWMDDHISKCCPI